MNTFDILFSHPLFEWNKLDNNVQNTELVGAFNKISNSSDQVLIVRSVYIILVELNCSQDSELG